MIGKRNKGTLRARRLGFSKGINGDVYKSTVVPDPLDGRLVQLLPLHSPSHQHHKITANMTTQPEVSVKPPITGQDSTSINADDPDTTLGRAGSVQTKPGSSRGSSSLFTRASSQVPSPPKDKWEVVELAETAVTPGDPVMEPLTDYYVLESLTKCFQRDEWYEREFLVADIPVNEVSPKLQHACCLRCKMFIPNALSWLSTHTDFA